MKKKVIALVLSGMMVCSLTACGGSGSAAESSAPAQTETAAAVDDEEEEAEVEEETEVEEEAEVEETEVMEVETEAEVSDDLQAFLQQLSLLGPTEDIIGTGWTFSGGMVDGAEMEQEDADAALELYNGSLEIVFDDEENIRDRKSVV